MLDVWQAERNTHAMTVDWDDLRPGQKHAATHLPVAGELLTVLLADLIRKATSDLPEALTEFSNLDTYDYIAEITDGEFINETLADHLPGMEIELRSQVRGLCRSVLQLMLSLTWPLDKTQGVLTARAAITQEQARFAAVTAENRAAAAATDAGLDAFAADVRRALNA